MTQVPQPRESSISPEPKISRKQRRHQQLQQRHQQDSLALENDTEISEKTNLTVELSIAPSMTAPATRLLVCSIGNPGPYITTLHSAGHTVLSSLAGALSYSSFQRSRAYGNGLVSAGQEYTLWQSSSLMNISGVGVAKAWAQFVKDSRGEQVRLVVVHDELEAKLGEVKVKKGDASPKGHNGLKSIKEQLRGVEWTRIGVGIGRPESREPDAVAAYVLRKMSAQERAKVEGASLRVMDELRRLGAGR